MLGARPNAANETTAVQGPGIPLTQAFNRVSAGFHLCIALYIAVIIAKPDGFFADDSYFYFQVAWNFANKMGSTFNGLMTTNGYHPLWMLVCAIIFKFLPSKTAAVHGIGAALCTCDVVMLLLIRNLLSKVGDNLWWIAFVILVPFSFLSQLGTEGALSGCLLAAVASTVFGFVSDPTPRRAVVYNVAAALAVLARLDNIFIVGFVWLSVLLYAQHGERSRLVRAQLLCIPVYLVFWGCYIASNLHYFGIVEPISGMVKSHPFKHAQLGGNLPHTAQYALAIIVLSVPLLWWKKRDLFFRVVELPFSLGVLCHAGFIVFRMSGETRWSWYYTSWILLSSLVLTRVVSIFLPFFAGGLRLSYSALSKSLAWGCLLVVGLAWVRTSLPHLFLSRVVGQPTIYQGLAESEGMHIALAFDKPGKIAYYSNIRVIPLDSLMGNIDFQRQLISQGIDRYAMSKQVDTFIGPPVPLNDYGHSQFCETLYLDSVIFHCRQTGPDSWMPVGVEVYSRIPHAYVGTLALREQQLLWSKPGDVSFWRIATSHKTD